MSNELVVQRLRGRLDRDAAHDNLDEMVEKNGRIEGRPFSFKGHEYQRDIIRDTHPRQSGRKCSQVGFSELMVQKLLALAAVLNGKRLIFTLPTAGFAIKFSKDRVDNAIQQSEYYSGLVKRSNDSASQKQIGSNVVYIGGTFGDSGAISVPAEYLINDEVDFSNQMVLGKLSSRLRHASVCPITGVRGHRYRFSTPTVPKFGVDALFTRGDQMFYAVKCSCCRKWVVPDFYRDFRIPGFDRPLIEFEKFDLENPRYRSNDAWISCPECRNDLWQDLLNPDRRQWIATYPDRQERSRQVYPWDVPTYNSPASVIQQMADYESTQDYLNFVVGLPHADADNSFFVDDDFVRKQVRDRIVWAYNTIMQSITTVMGIDTGKLCHLVVMAQMGDKTAVIWAERIRNTPDTPAFPQLDARRKYYRCLRVCIDAGPDISLANAMVSSSYLGHISAVEYITDIKGLDITREKADGQVLEAARTKTLSALLKAHNSGKIVYAKEIYSDVFAHLDNIKKMRRDDPATGEKVEYFEKTGDDHYGHAMNYANIARMEVEAAGGSAVFGMPAVVTGAPINYGDSDQNSSDFLKAFFS